MKLPLFSNTYFIFLISFYLTTNFYAFANQTSPAVLTQSSNLLVEDDGCSGLHNYTDYRSKCVYIRSNKSCKPKGYINCLEIFYCSCGKFPVLGYSILLLWLVLLFYLLANTASEYFCPAVENLSKILNLSPTIAGTTLLPLGNGAPDVIASIVSFTRSGDGDVGLNSVLGGAFVISSIVVGVISILIKPNQIIVNKPSFIRDVVFLLFSLISLIVIIVVGRINLWVAICFASIYVVYISVVWTMHLSSSEQENFEVDGNDLGEIRIPLLGYVDEEKCNSATKNVSEDSDEGQLSRCCCQKESSCRYLRLFLNVIELPLQLPRRLTIPMVSEERWSKPFAVISVILAPTLLATLWNSQKEDLNSKTKLVIYIASLLIGMVLGYIAFVTTKMSRPPKLCLFPWLAGRFIMSITWTYIIAEELVSLLVSLGNIIGISPSILGVTVLAWGNSVGDLIANVAMALHGGPDGAQIAISGCYAGPVFNTLVGLGMSLVCASWSEYPKSYVIPVDSSLYETIGFLMCGLLWALVILPRKNMRPDRYLGGGLLAIYFCFMFLKIAGGLGLLKLNGS
ncbi:Cation/calcium exchanger 1 [Heracleum sosnowskyi]|uniref:Cation/calcium exchanger 1 n=1 Tax=Heracleum sosnowskyi TaxID=360622 RepID=A0AAD8JJ10_9APIA|nr:Cation/calcium exchanger 1 [Heracleum sosnowskyi]